MAGRTVQKPELVAAAARATHSIPSPATKKTRRRAPMEAAQVSTSTSTKGGVKGPTAANSSARRLLQPGSTPIQVRESMPFDVLDFRGVYGASPFDRMFVIKTGIPAEAVAQVARKFNITQEVLMGRLGMKKTTISRKAQAGGRLSAEQSERLVGMAKLVGQVEAIVEESGDPEAVGHFDAATWLEDWLSHPNPALGNVLPSTYLDTHEGREVLSTLLAQMQSGAYA